MGASDSSMRQAFAAQPNLLFQWLDESFRGGDLKKALRLLELEPQKCMALRYAKANEPGASVNPKRASKLAMYVHPITAEQSSALHVLCRHRFYDEDNNRIGLKLGLQMLALDPKAHHCIDANGTTPFGHLVSSVRTTHSDEYFGTQLALMHKMLDLGLGEADRAQIVTHLCRFGYYWSAAELSRLHHRVWDLALEVAFPEGTHPLFGRALLLLATSGRSPDNVQGGSIDDAMTAALAVPGAVRPDLVWSFYQESVAAPAKGLVPNTLPIWLLFLKLDHIESVRAMLLHLPVQCETVLHDHVVAVVATGQSTVFHLATGNGRTFKTLSDERDRYAKRAEPLCIELLEVTQRLFPNTWRNSCWLLKDANHRTPIDNAREMQMMILLKRMGELP